MRRKPRSLPPSAATPGSSSVANFDGDNGQRFTILPDTRALRSGPVVVHRRRIRPLEAPVEVDGGVGSGPAGWRGVTVLTEGPSAVSPCNVAISGKCCDRAASPR
jgi:hypothetical protein